ncbi:RNA-directed DNA polymerase, eukaryota, reverse transcriptase zinc-binding domain protein [Tanacetum coccineum]
MTIKNRSSRRQKRVPQWFSDHVMENTSQKINDNGVQEVTEEIRAKLDGCGDGIGENDLELNKRVKDEINKNLNYMPTVTNDTGTEVIVFDEMLVRKASERWNLTASGYFVAYKMPPYELRYNIRRMWGKFRVKDIIVNNDGACLFKFRDNNRLNSVVEKGPWMVNGKLLIVQKWNHELGMQMSEHSKLPIWVRLSDVPLEAWSVDGISALARSLGNPLIMDTTTAVMCHNGMGRLDYARVLVEMVADKEFKKVIEVRYRDGENKVFGHEFKGCTKRPRTPKEEEDVKRKEEALSKLKNDNMDTFGEQDRLKKASFRQYNYKGNGNQNDTRAGKNNKGVFGNNFRYKRQEYRIKQTDYKGKESDGTNDKKEGNKKQWPLKQNEFEAMKKIANKFSILQSLLDDNLVEINTLKDRMIVDQFLNRKIQPSVLEINNWSKDMIKYFKEKWEEDRKRDVDNDMQKNESMESDEDRSYVVFQPFLVSDYSPAILVIPHNCPKKPKSFRFANYTADKPEFINEVINGLKFQVECHKMFCITKKLKHMKTLLNKLNWKHEDLIVRVEQLRIKLIKAQAQVEKDPYNMDIKSKAVLILDEYNEAMQDEEKLLAQKAKVDWLTEEDKNSSFFHKVIKGRRSRNRVATIYDEEGNYFEGDDVPKQFVNHFQKFLGMPSICSDIVMTNDLFCNVLTPKEAVWMVRNVTNDEVKDAMFDIGDNRALGPDGYTSMFFKKA